MKWLQCAKHYVKSCASTELPDPYNYLGIGVIIITTGEGNGTPLQYSCLENPWTEEPGGLQSMGSLRVGHDWATSVSLFTFIQQYCVSLYCIANWISYT